MRSLLANINLLRVLVDDYNPKILLLSETRTINSMTESELKISGYKLFRCDAENRHTGGVVIYVHESISAHVVFEYKVNYIWCLAINIVRGFQNDCFCVIYRGHQNTDKDFLGFFEELCEKLASNAFVHILGDLNYIFGRDSMSKKICSIAKTFNFKQQVKNPTRITNTTETLIDYYFTNRKNVKCEVTDKNQIADHM